MSIETLCKFVYLTLPDPDRPVLNVQALESKAFWRFELTRDQLFALNAQTADALLKGKPR